MGFATSFKLLMHYFDFRIIDTRAWYGSTGTIPTLGNFIIQFPSWPSERNLRPDNSRSVESLMPSEE